MIGVLIFGGAVCPNLTAFTNVIRALKVFLDVVSAFYFLRLRDYVGFQLRKMIRLYESLIFTFNSIVNPLALL